MEHTVPITMIIQNDITFFSRHSHFRSSPPYNITFEEPGLLAGVFALIPGDSPEERKLVVRSADGFPRELPQTNKIMFRACDGPSGSGNGGNCRQEEKKVSIIAPQPIKVMNYQ